MLSLTLNIDGGLIADKSTHSLWPVQLYQNYIPPEIRFLPENILVAGLYYGDHKPDPYELLYPLLSELRHLFEIEIQLMHNGIQYDFLPILLYCSCDLPARAILQNFKHPTGANACPVCLHPGDHNKEDRMRIRYKKERTPSNIRTHDGTIKHAYLDNNNYGVKGLSCLFALPEFDIIDGFSTDYMHGVFLGALKRLLSLWTGKLKSTKFKPLNKKKQEILNNRLTSIKPYSRISYLPRSLEEHATF